MSAVGFVIITNYIITRVLMALMLVTYNEVFIVVSTIQTTFVYHLLNYIIMY